jgi:NTE family protein
MATGQGKRIGLALGGGAVHGVAHIGALQVLEREGIRPAVVSGVSAGSAVGAIYCAGHGPDQLEQIVRGLRWSHMARLAARRLSLFDTRRLEDYVDELVGGRTFAELPLPFVAVAVDVLTSEIVALHDGPVARAVRASCAIPGLFSPVELDGRLLVDGGVLNNVPVSVLRDTGAEYVIAIDVVPPIIKHRRPRSPLEMGAIGLSMLIAGHSEWDQADLPIRPDIAHLSLVDFKDVPELLQRGREAMEAALPALRADLGLVETADQEESPALLSMDTSVDP